MYNNKSKANVNYECGVIMMCPCRFFDCNKCTIFTGDVDNEGDCWGWAVCVWEISVPSPSYCCEHKTTLKKK